MEHSGVGLMSLKMVLGSGGACFQKGREVPSCLGMGRSEVGAFSMDTPPPKM